MTSYRNSDKAYDSFNVDFGYDKYIFFYDESVMDMTKKLIERNIPKFREYKNFEGQTVRRQMFPDTFKLRVEMDYSNDNITVYLVSPKGTDMYCFIFDPKDHYIEIYKFNTTYFCELDRHVQLDAVHKRTLV